MNIQIKASLIVVLSAVLSQLSGCFTSSARQTQGDWHDASHKVDAVLAAYQLPDQNIVIFVKGRLSGSDDPVAFSLFVQRSDLNRVKSEHEAEHPPNKRFSLKAAIVLPSQEKDAEWTPLGVVASTSELNKDKLIPGTAPLLYTGPAQWGAKWGYSEIRYVEKLANGSPFRCEINPDAKRVKHERNWAWWLPLTVPLDIVTLPFQAVWAVLTIVVLAGAQ